MKPVTIPQPTRGLDNRTELTAVLAGGVREATNISIKPSGAFSRRWGYETAVGGSGFHGVHPYAGGALVVQSGVLNFFDHVGLGLTPLTDLGAAGPVSFTEYAGRTYVLGQRGLLYMDGLMPRPVGVDTPLQLPAILTHSVGTMTPGTYGFALCVVDDEGEESGAVWLGSAHTDAGIRLSGLESNKRHRIYMTPQNGGTLYLAAETHPGLTDYIITDESVSGKLCETLHMQRFPGGQIVRGHRGRLFVASGSSVLYSKPLRPHLYEPAHDFISFVGSIDFMEPVDGGAYVGDERGVWFLKGGDAEAFTVTFVSKHRGVVGSSVTLSGTELGLESHDEHALWLTGRGFAVGTPDGAVNLLQDQRVSLPGGMTGASRAIGRDGFTQVVVLTADDRKLSSPNAAIDLPMRGNQNAPTP